MKLFKPSNDDHDITDSFTRTGPYHPDGKEAVPTVIAI
jgi:hypothetical protein